jgi:hypothetical protein
LRGEEKSEQASPNLARVHGARRSNKNRVEFRVPHNESWIYESIANNLFHKGYIDKPTVGQAVRFCFNIVAADHIAEGTILAAKLSGLIPVTKYEKLLEELEHEKQRSMLYQQANEAFQATLEDQKRTIDNLTTLLKGGVRDREGSTDSGIDPSVLPNNSASSKGLFSLGVIIDPSDSLQNE